MEMKVNGIHIVGRSVSGYGTSVALPEMGLLFDCGIANYEAVQCDTVLITHGHLDHFGDVARQAYIREMTGMSPTTFIVPPWLKNAVDETFTFWAKVQRARKITFDVRISGRTRVRKDRLVQAFPTNHRIKSQGYVVVDERKRLKPEYQGLPGQELGRLRREGVVFEEIFTVPMVAFTGDTRATIYDEDILALKAKVLIVECTFLDDVTVEEARKKGHTHISELAARADRFVDVGALVLTHFSKRYSNADIEAAIATLPESLREKTSYLRVGK